MERHQIGLYASALAPICDILAIGVDPISTFTEYTEVVGTDLNGQPIEAGFPVASWSWAVMHQADFDLLLVYTNQRVRIRTRNNSGASGFDFGAYIGYCNRPVAEVEGLLRRTVVLSFIALVPA